MLLSKKILVVVYFGETNSTSEKKKLSPVLRVLKWILLVQVIFIIRTANFQEKATVNTIHAYNYDPPARKYDVESQPLINQDADFEMVSVLFTAFFETKS